MRPEEKNPNAVALGKLGGAKGGRARAEKLQPERREEIARIAAQARWTKRREEQGEEGREDGTKVTRDSIVHAIHVVGRNGRHFQSREVREHLGVSPSQRNAATKIHNVIKRHEVDGEIEEIPSSRKRNKYYRIASEQGISATASSGSDQKSGHPPSSAPDRLSRIEESLQRVAQRMDELDQKVDRLVSIWT